MIKRLESGEATVQEVDELVRQWFDGRIKLLVTTCGLRFRRDHHETLLRGANEALSADGEHANHLVAFARHGASGTVVAVVPRLTISLTCDSRRLPCGPNAWGDTRIALPESAPAGPLRHLLTGEVVHTVERYVQASNVLNTIPAALLWAAASERRQ